MITGHQMPKRDIHIPVIVSYIVFYVLTSIRLTNLFPLRQLD